AGEHNLSPRRGNTYKRVVEHTDNVHPGKGAVVDIPGNQDKIYGVFLHELNELVDEMALGVQHPDSMEGPAQMPVRGVQYPHVSKLSGPSDNSGGAGPHRLVLGRSNTCYG